MIVKQNITSYYLKDITAFFQYKMKLPEIKNPKLITIVGEYHGAKIGCNEDFKSLPIEAFVLLNNNVKTKVILELDHEDDPNYSFNIKNIQDSVKFFIKEMNRTAKKMDLNNTFYTNPHGLMDKFNKSTKNYADLMPALVGLNLNGIRLIESDIKDIRQFKEPSFQVSGFIKSKCSLASGATLLLKWQLQQCQL
jgi:hypothetical protein